MSEPPTTSPRVAIWGSELSPFTLKLRALCDAAGTACRMLPEEGGRLENYRALARIARAKRRRTAVRYPSLSELDEYPLVPFLLSAVAIDRFSAFFQRMRGRMIWVSRISGAVLIGIGVLMVTNYFTILASWLTGLTPDFLLERI